MADQTNPDTPQGQQSSSAKPELRQHELVNKLAPDPSQRQPLTILSGFLGQSPQAGYWRLYLTPTLDEYVEIPEGDIVHSESAPGGTTLWVRSGTPLQYTYTASHQIQAEFLQGPLTTGVRARATGFPAVNPRAGLIKVRTGIPCSADACSIPCGSDYGCGTAQGCYTSPFTCQGGTDLVCQ